MSFEIKTCPLCNLDLISKDIRNVSSFACSVECNIPGVGSEYIASHYVVERTKTLGDIQRIYIYPWSIDSMGNKSRLYKYHEQRNTWQFIKELPLLKVDTKENLLKRINNLLCFL